MSTKFKWRRWWPFAAICAVAWVRLNLLESVPAVASSSGSEFVGCGVAVVVAYVVALVTRRSRPAWKLMERGAVAGALLVCGPQAALFFDVPATFEGVIIGLALTPVVIALAVAAGRNGSGLSAAALWPGMAASAGLLVLLVQPSLADVRSDVAWVVAPVAAGIGCVMLWRLQTEWSVWLYVGVLAGAAGVFGLDVLASAAERSAFHSASVWAIGFDAVLALLSVLAAMRVQPLQYAAQYVVVPFLVLVEGQLQMKIVPGFRAFSGLAMLLVAAGALLRSGQGRESAEMPSLRT